MTAAGKSRSAAAKFAWIVAGTAAAFALAAPVRAEEQPQKPETPGEMAREGAQLLLDAIELLIRSLPHYDPPVINENGDIIIRRRNPPEEELAPESDRPPDPEALEETRT